MTLTGRLSGIKLPNETDAAFALSRTDVLGATCPGLFATAIRPRYRHKGFGHATALYAWNWMKKPRAPGQIEQIRQQYAALPFRYVVGLEVLLITSRETQRWIIPKGWPMKGRRPPGTAAREALQEAGVVGAISKSPIGGFTYIKRGLGGQSWPCRVDVFPLAVRTERTEWRERDQRTRQWFSFIEAAAVVMEPELKTLILAFGVAFDRV